ncbi:tetratricopeptide repeat protein [Corynebacterium lizhenjunii]|uniref:tetratricopeptide repeat protein n=1 Tax=Corynebacterium lizhenjunii TaxID=2709394 RepID=UPI0013EB3C05|nr:tetratricopeptide repeat protein [Corynebacterium lizhenjunii]
MTIPQRFVGGALDLGQLKANSQARGASADAPATSTAGNGGVAPFFAVDDSNFEDALVRRSAQVPVIVLIGTARSPQSEQLKSDFEQLAAAGGLRFIVGYIDADTHPQIAQAFGVRNLPTTVAVANGQPLTSFEGGQPREALEQWLAALVEQVGSQLPGIPDAEAAQPGAPEEELDPRVTQAEEALNAGDFDAAIAVYDQILADDPQATEVKQARDTTRLLQRISGIEDPLAAAEQDPSPQAQMAAADAEVVAGVPEKAFARLIESMKAAAGDDKALVRERLLELFGLFDAGDPRVLAARTQLASALY